MALAILQILGVFGFLILHNANDSSDVALRFSATIFACAAIFACVACNIIDPGMPEPDPLDLGPDDPSCNEQRIRKKELLDGSGQVWMQKWCRECKLWRPYRCGHCHTCKRCVLRLDHHCFVVGNCIGERNARFFATFLFCGGTALILLIVLGIHRVGELHCWSDPMRCTSEWEPIAIILVIFCCPSPCFCISQSQSRWNGHGFMS